MTDIPRENSAIRARWQTCLRLARELLLVGPGDEDLKLGCLHTLIDTGHLGPTRHPRKKILVIGAGITGLVAGRFVGDGAFQETCQEISTHTRLGLRSVVFVMDNGHFYGIEQMLVHPSYYTEPGPTGPDFYNVLHPWHYDRLAALFAGKDTPANGVVVADTSEMDALLARLADPADPVNAGPLLVRVRLRRHDYPRVMAYKVPKPTATA
ncbi:thiamine pyrophosphate-dependent enzyme [Streptomyces sp. M2CJ-2]|uniref:thiamine pyrophosphate-dependent enzyme n=1 Tax=Streptomyces sp. M2CJ-2 TaxID=2803948 RepID=UPI0027DDD473|nr:thiamine pyrophosphate-dependent enzyme [Streptomyces sp. M2CJ-2]